MITEYKTLAAPSQGLYKDRGSRFLAFAFPVKNENEVKIFLNEVKNAHQCSHYCYAFRLKPNGSLFRCSDDREPSGSAGKPILNQLLSNELTNVLIIVARYFGGSLLGVPGLINAYRSAAADAVANGQLIVQQVMENDEVTFPYSRQNEVMHLLKSFHAIIVNEQFDDNITITFEVPVIHAMGLKDRFMKAGLNRKT